MEANLIDSVRFYILTAVTITDATIWDVMPYAAEVPFCLHGLLFQPKDEISTFLEVHFFFVS
jgi:hypothetical protein